MSFRTSLASLLFPKLLSNAGIFSALEAHGVEGLWASELEYGIWCCPPIIPRNLSSLSSLFWDEDSPKDHRSLTSMRFRV
jgi:hypothetical protein